MAQKPTRSRGLGAAITIQRQKNKKDTNVIKTKFLYIK